MSVNNRPIHDIVHDLSNICHINLYIKSCKIRYSFGVYLIYMKNMTSLNFLFYY